jgi:probable F420-dependent oxidoreductase
VEESIRIIKDLAEGREADIGGNKVHIPWVENGRLDVWMAGYGPKALTLAGRIADGFILQLADPYLLEWSMRYVHNAAVTADRDPKSVKVCVAAPAYVGNDLAHQRSQCRWFGGMVGNHVADLVARYGERGEIPTALTYYIKARQGYDYGYHGKADNLSSRFVPDDIVDRFCVLGTVKDHVAKLLQLKELGVDQFNIYLMHDAQEETLDAYGEEIIPALE